MLTLSNARVRRGPQVLLDEATVTIFRTEKIGIVGRNGCGKSTLLALIRGELAPDAGEYTAPAGLAIAWVAQELPDTDSALLQYILDGDLELRAVEAELARARELGEGTRDDEDLVLRVPNESGIRSLRNVLARLGDDVAVEDLSIHTPDLDDVFFALTGNASKESSH